MSEATALIADDEPELIRHLEQMLGRAWPELTVVARARDGLEALEGLHRHRPDVAFLDIRMPGLDGMAVAERLGSDCQLVFVTAYDEYAVDAFEREALDYLLKPVQPARLEQTVRRLRASLGAPAPDWREVLHRLEGQLGAGERYLSWLRIGHGDEVRILPVDEVVYFQAGDKYTSAFTAEGEHLLRTPLRELEGRLDPEQFWRVHRRSLVNMAEVAAAEREFAGRLLLRFRSRPETVRVSRRYAHRFRQL